MQDVALEIWSLSWLLALNKLSDAIIVIPALPSAPAEDEDHMFKLTFGGCLFPPQHSRQFIVWKF
jgi:hypothetical protein